MINCYKYAFKYQIAAPVCQLSFKQIRIERLIALLRMPNNPYKDLDIGYII